MVNKMNVDKTILEELRRYNQINNYITEQEALDVPPPTDAPPEDTALGGIGAPPADAGAALPPPPPAAPEGPMPVDVDNDPDVEKVGEEKEGGETGEESEELDITDLVNSQKTIETKQEEYFNNLFSQLDTLQNKLGEMDKLVGKIDSLEAKIDKYRPKTPQEKLELRSIDSGPFNQKLTDFFVDKEEDMEKSGKNEYVLTTDQVKDFSVSDVKDSFRAFPGNERPVEVK
jgi:hypothetical protein